jgi:dihydrolipoamide dehydrogenase
MPSSFCRRDTQGGIALASTASSPFDLVVIGSGPGGYVAAVRAAQLGQRVAIVEKAPKFGGTCLHWGCIPTKALLHVAALYGEIQHAGDIGIEVGKAAINFAKVQERKDAVVGKLAKAVEGLLKRRKVEMFAGTGSLADPRTVVVTGKGGETTQLATKRVLLATGSAVRSLPTLPVDGERILSSDDILRIDRIPESLLVVGAGAVGVEFATVFASFGTKVTIIEILPTLLPIEDEEIGRELARAFKKRGIDVRTGARVEKVDADKKGVRVTIASDGGASETLTVEKVLVAVGRRPVSDGLGLEKTRVALDKGFVKVDGRCRTAEPGVYAIGDLIALPDGPHPQLAHVASHEGMYVAAECAGREAAPVDYDRIPSCTYCTPEVASVGLTEAEARKRGYEVRIGKFPFLANSKATILGETDGLVKVVSEARYDQVLGVHVVGPRATELISEGVSLLSLEATALEMAHAVHPHPTLSEALMEAAEAVYGHAIHG